MPLYADFYRTYCKKNHMKPDVNFIRFMNCVEKLVKDVFGINLLDLPDENYRVMYNNNHSVEDVAEYVVLENMQF